MAECVQQVTMAECVRSIQKVKTLKKVLLDFLYRPVGELANHIAISVPGFEFDSRAGQIGHKFAFGASSL